MSKKNDSKKKDGYYRFMAESSRDIIVTHDLRGKIIYVNPAWTKVSGYTVEETQGKSITDFISPNHEGGGEKHPTPRGAGGEGVYTYELDVLSKTGEKIPLEIRSTPIVDKGEVEGILLVGYDLRKRKTAENALSKSEASYKNLFDSIDDAIYIQDKKGRFLDVNEGAIKLYGFPKEEFIGKTPLFLSAPEKNDLDDIAKKIEKAFNGEAQVFEFWGKKSNGEIFPKEVHVYKGIYFGEEVVIALARDITERKDTEATLQNQLKELNTLQATAFASTQASDSKELIRQITNIIGNTLYPDNFGILLLDKDTRTLHPHPSYQGIPTEQVFLSVPLSKGITGKVASTGKALCVTDTRKSAEYVAFTSSTRSELCVPIKMGEEILGVINAESSKQGFFTANDERLLTVIAGQTAIALEKTHLFETEKKRRQIAEKLQESAAILTTTLEQETAITFILKELSEVISFDGASVQLLKGDCLEIVGGQGALVLEEEMGRRFPYPGDNPNTEVIQTGLPLILNNAPKAYPAFREMPSVQSWLGVPLIARNEPVGILTLDSGKINHFTEEDAQLVMSFANHAAIAIQNTTLFNAEKNRRKESETLKEIALAVTASLNLNEAVDRILKQLGRVLPHDSASVQILENNELVIFGGYGWLDHDEVKEMRFPLDGSNPNTRVIQEKKILILDDAKREYAPFHVPPHDHINSWMGVPLIIRDKTVGMLAVDSKEKGHFTEESARIAQSFAYLASIAIENARHFAAEQKRRQEAEVLRQSAHTISSSLNLEEVFSTILASIKRAIPYHSASIMLLEDDKVKITGGKGLLNIEQQIGKTFSAKDLLTEKLITKAHPLILEDAQKKPHFKKWAETDYVRGWMSIPLIVRSKVIGYITLDNLKVNAYTERDAELAQIFAHQAASAIENARLFNETTQRGKEFAEIYSLTQDLIAPQKMEILLKTTLERAALLLGVSYGGIYLYNPKTERLNPASTYGLSEERTKKIMEISLAKGEGIAGHVAKTSKAFRVTDYHSWEGMSPQFQDMQISSILGVPMLYAGNLIGVMNFYEIYPTTHHFTEANERIISLFATQVAGAVHSAKQFEQLKNRLAELESINQTSTALRSAETPQEILSVLLEEVKHSLKVEVCSIWLNDSRTNEVFRAVACGWIKDILPDRQKNNVGLIGHIFQSGENYTTPNLNNDPYIKFTKKNKSLDNWCGAWVPIRSTDTIIGVVGVMAETPRNFSEDTLRLLTTLAEIAGSAIQRAHFYEHTEKQVKRLTALRNIDSAISANFDLQITLQLLIDHTVSQLDIDAASILLIEASSKNLKFFVGRGFKTKYFADTILQVGNGLPSEAIQEHSMRYTTSPHENKLCKRGAGFLAENFCTYYCAPLIAKGEVLGVLEIFHSEALSPTSEWENFIQTLAGQAAIAIDNSNLLDNLENSNRELSRAYDITLEGWGKALALRDQDTREHTRSVTELTLTLAREIGMAEADLKHVHRGALLHDIGKMGIPDNILRKPGPLNKKEWEIMRQHPQYAYDMLSEIPYLLSALDIPYCHHERWDGTGYPRGLKGDEIPLAARIFSVVDVWDALLRDRPYRKAWKKETVLDYIRNESGTRFDPKIVEVFMKIVGDKF